MRRRAVLAIAGAALLAAPAEAARVDYGSDLSRPATLTESHPRDWTAWPVSPVTGGAVVPQAGEVAAITVRGTIVAPSGLPPLFVFRALVMRPQGDGTLRVMIASTDLAPQLVNRDPATVTRIDLLQYAERMCVLPGDVVGIATSGGYDPQAYPQGVPVQMFAGVSRASYGLYEERDPLASIENGRALRPGQVSDAEALLRVTVGTGTDARPTCRVPDSSPSPSPSPSATPAPTPGPTAPGSGPVELPLAKTTRVRRGRAKLKVTCPGAVACAGRLELSRKSKPYGSAAFELLPGATKRVTVKLNRAGRRALRKAGALTVRASAKGTGSAVSARTVLRR